MNKPLVIQLREAKENLLACVNAAVKGGIPCYLLEPIVADLHRAVSTVAAQEYKSAQERMKTEGKDGAEDGLGA